MPLGIVAQNRTPLYQNVENALRTQSEKDQPKWFSPLQFLTWHISRYAQDAVVKRGIKPCTPSNTWSGESK